MATDYGYECRTHNTLATWMNYRGYPGDLAFLYAVLDNVEIIERVRNIGVENSHRTIIVDVEYYSGIVDFVVNHKGCDLVVCDEYGNEIKRDALQQTHERAVSR